MRTLAAEARCIPEQTNNNEGRGADLQIVRREFGESHPLQSGPPPANDRGSGILVDLHDNGFGFGDSPHEDMAVK
jgi:hypothetical protein